MPTWRMFAPAFTAETWTNKTSFGQSASLLSAETGGPSAGFMLCAERGGWNTGNGHWPRRASTRQWQWHKPFA